MSHAELNYMTRTGVTPSCLQANELLKVLVSGGGTFDFFTGAVTVIAAAHGAAAIRALALAQTLEAKQK